MKLKSVRIPVALCCLFFFLTQGYTQDLFSSLVGEVPVETVRTGGTIEVPFITWGGDVATFHANGGLKKKTGTIFAHQGLDLNLVPGDEGKLLRAIAHWRSTVLVPTPS